MQNEHAVRKKVLEVPYNVQCEISLNDVLIYFSFVEITREATKTLNSETVTLSKISAVGNIFDPIHSTPSYEFCFSPH